MIVCDVPVPTIDCTDCGRALIRAEHEDVTLAYSMIATALMGELATLTALLQTADPFWPGRSLMCAVFVQDCSWQYLRGAPPIVFTGFPEPSYQTCDPTLLRRIVFCLRRCLGQNSVQPCATQPIVSHPRIKAYEKMRCSVISKRMRIAG